MLTPSPESQLRDAVLFDQPNGAVIKNCIIRVAGPCRKCSSTFPGPRVAIILPGMVLFTFSFFGAH
jgi:acyl-CoA synthetase (AMP-forming)/AMP-acid ligase II